MPSPPNLNDQRHQPGTRQARGILLVKLTLVGAAPSVTRLFCARSDEGAVLAQGSDHRHIIGSRSALRARILNNVQASMWPDVRVMLLSRHTTPASERKWWNSPTRGLWRKRVRAPMVPEQQWACAPRRLWCTQRRPDAKRMPQRPDEHNGRLEL